MGLHMGPLAMELSNGVDHSRQLFLSGVLLSNTQIVIMMSIDNMVSINFQQVLEVCQEGNTPKFLQSFW